MIRFLILLVFMSYSCSPSKPVSETPSAPPINTYSEDSLYIFFTGGFMNDSLVIEYSGTRIIETGVTTNEVSGFSMENVLPNKGLDTIQVRLIRPNRSYSTEIINKGGTFIEVWYCEDDELKHYSRPEPFRVN